MEPAILPIELNDEESYYNCSDCPSLIEIAALDEENNTIKFICLAKNEEKTVNIKEYLEKMKKYKTDIKDKCDEHDNKRYKYYCLDCKSHLCGKCLKKTKIHREHKLIIIDQLQPEEDLKRIEERIEKYKDEIKQIKDKKTEIEKLINERKDKKEVIKTLSEYLRDKKALDLLEINLERFYYFCLFYNNLKNSGIKFCFCFIADIIEDKLENILEEKIKLYKNDYKDIEQQIKIEDESKDIEQQIKIEDESEEKMEIKKPNEFIIKIKDIIEKNNKIKSSLMVISDQINRKIKEFIESKNNILKRLDKYFVSFNNNNKQNFLDICNKIFGDWKVEDSLITKIYSDKMFFFFIFFLPKENNININEIKTIIKNNLNALSFEVIQNDKKEEIDNYIKSQNIKVNYFHQM